MITQKFEKVPEANRLEMMVDMLRYENASQAGLIANLEAEIASFLDRLKSASDDMDKLQQVLDMQNAQAFDEQTS